MSGVRKRFEICQCDQCYDDIINHCDNAAHGALVSDCDVEESIDERRVFVYS